MNLRGRLRLPHQGLRNHYFKVPGCLERAPPLTNVPGMDKRKEYGTGGDGVAAFKVQDQIRRNAQDMQEYLADLGTWERSIKKKDKQLSRKASTAARTGAREPSTPRSESSVSMSTGPAPESFQGSTKGESSGITPQLSGNPSCSGNPDGGKVAGKQPAMTEKWSAAGHTHDIGYDKWAKFDVDAALRSIDSEDRGGNKKKVTDSDCSSDSDIDGFQESSKGPAGLTPATMVDRSAGRAMRRPPVKRHPPPPATVTQETAPRDLEKEERERGNAKFVRGDFEGAVKCYTRCLGINSKSCLAFSNRSMAYLKLKEFGKAEADGDTALKLDARHVKSLQRRAAARNTLGKHRAALADLQNAAEIDPSSKEIRKDLNKTLEALKTAVRRAPKTLVEVVSAPLPAPRPRDYTPQNGSKASLSPPAPPTVRAHDVAGKVPDVGTPAQFSNPPPSSELVTQPMPIDAVSAKDPVAEEGVGLSKGASAGDDNVGHAEGAVKSPSAHAPEVAGSLVVPQAVMQNAPSASKQAATGATQSGDANSKSSTEIPGAVRLATRKAIAVGEPSRAHNDSSKMSIVRETNGESPEIAHPSEGEATKHCFAPKRTAEKTKASARWSNDSAGGVATRAVGAQQAAPTTGYQFEQVWRSTEGLKEARLELLRTIQPSSVSKMFRRTPLEVELLSGILRHLEEALLPRRPATTFRWLKSLSKASRFGMTVALLGEGPGREATRELLVRLEEAPPEKVDPSEVETLRKMYLL